VTYQIDNPQIAPTTRSRWASRTCRSATARGSTAWSWHPDGRDYIKNGKPVKIVGEPLFYEPIAVAVDKGDP